MRYRFHARKQGVGTSHFVQGDFYIENPTFVEYTNSLHPGVYAIIAGELYKIITSLSLTDILSQKPVNEIVDLRRT